MADFRNIFRGFSVNYLQTGIWFINQELYTLFIFNAASCFLKEAVCWLFFLC